MRYPFAAFCEDRAHGGGMMARLPQLAALPAFACMLGIALLAACASTASTSTGKVQDGDPAVVNRDCKLLGSVSGRSVFGGSDTARMEGAMQDARNKAANMGATHVVFLTIDNSGMFNTGQTTARAYRCDAKAG